MRRLLLLGLLAVAACDSSAPPDLPPPADLDPALFLGTWALDDAQEVERITVTRAQEVPIFSEAATGVLTASGADSETFPYPTRYLYEPEGAARRFNAYDVPGGNGEWASSLGLSQADSGDSLAIHLNIRSDGALHRYLAWLTGDQIGRVAFERLSVRVDSVVVPHVPGEAPPGEVVVDGHLALATRRVEAGEALSQRSRWLLRSTHHIEFEHGGGLVLHRDGQAGPQSGTWEVVGRTLHVRIPAQQVDAAFDIEATDRGIRLTATEPGSAPEWGAEYSVETRFHVEVGTASELRTVTTLDLTR